MDVRIATTPESTPQGDVHCNLLRPRWNCGRLPRRLGKLLSDTSRSMPAHCVGGSPTLDEAALVGNHKLGSSGPHEHVAGTCSKPWSRNCQPCCHSRDSLFKQRGGWAAQLGRTVETLSCLLQFTQGSDGLFHRKLQPDTVRDFGETFIDHGIASAHEA